MEVIKEYRLIRTHMICMIQPTRVWQHKVKNCLYWWTETTWKYLTWNDMFVDGYPVSFPRSQSNKISCNKFNTMISNQRSQFPHMNVLLLNLRVHKLVFCGTRDTVRDHLHKMSAIFFGFLDPPPLQSASSNHRPACFRRTCFTFLPSVGIFG